MKLSAVNQIKGKVMEIRKGAVTTIIYVQIAGDQMIEVCATVASVEALGLFEGKNVTLVVNSTDIIIACE